MNKAELRKKMKEAMSSLDATKRKSVEDTLATNLVNSSLWSQANTIGITISSGFEWDTEPIIRKGWLEGKRMVVPKCYPKTKALVFYQLESYRQLEESSYQLLEPNPEETVRVKKEEIDLLIVPGLIFDKRGYRIGFGGGYYDRFLTDFSHETVSIFSSEQLVDRVPVEPFDIPVRHLITESGLLIVKQ